VKKKKRKRLGSLAFFHGRGEFFAFFKSLVETHIEIAQAFVERSFDVRSSGEVAAFLEGNREVGKFVGFSGLKAREEGGTRSWGGKAGKGRYG